MMMAITYVGVFGFDVLLALMIVGEYLESMAKWKGRIEQKKDKRKGWNIGI